MKIEGITLSISELPSNTDQFTLVEDIEGVGTVGDARYATLSRQDLGQLRIMVLGGDPLDRDHLNR